MVKQFIGNWVSSVVTGISVWILCDLKPLLGRCKKKKKINTDTKILGLQKSYATYPNFTFFLSVCNKIPIIADPFPLPPLSVVSLSPLRWLKYLDTVSPRSGIGFQRDQRHTPPPTTTFIPLKFGLISIGHDIPVPELPPSHEADNFVVVSRFFLWGGGWYCYLVKCQ